MVVGARDVSPMLLGIVPWGLVAGASVAEAGAGVLEAVGMSMGLFAGAAQLASTTLLGEGAPLFVVIGTALVINTRYIIYSSSIAPVIAPGSGRLRPVLGYLLVDQSYAVAMAEGRYRDDVDVVPYYAGASLICWSFWQVTNVIGVLAGNLVPESWSFDFAVPLVFLALLVPALKSRASIEVSMVSAVAAALLVPLLPLQTGLLAAIVAGMVWGAIRDSETGEPEIGPEPDGPW
jgi:4-azaleucine resistance transporter AzlC